VQTHLPTFNITIHRKELTMIKRITTLAAATLCAAFAAAPAQAQFAKPEDAVKYRQGALTVIGAHFGRLGAMANGRVPFDAKIAADNVAVIESVAKLPWAAFGAGTDVGTHRSKPEIWKEQDKFKKGSDDMVAAVGKLSAAAKSGNMTLDQLKAAFGDTAKTCKACHDAYRKE
jgi:cytochrome c556